ncbi:MAG: ATP-binding cassette domain-containing protein [Lactobacillaceae bacterium]|jgi:putative ABC transport system ATP-binding protein|nr:ATP-binding cassette domain-containing protein [Lactobacillaceae bacterium]
MTSVLEIKNATVVVNPSQYNQTTIMQDFNLTVNKGDFVVILGTNGAGKSTLFNIISGQQEIVEGSIKINGDDVTKSNSISRTKYLARVFQDPKLGTAPRMTVAENLLLAEKRGQKRKLQTRNLSTTKKEEYKNSLQKFGNGLEERIDTDTANLSGGQRQTLSFVMATSTVPDLLLLDEHTAALDPQTSSILMEETNRVVTEKGITTLMITHDIKDALRFGNRMIIIDGGKIVFEADQKTKKKVTEKEILKYL